MKKISFVMLIAASVVILSCKKEAVAVSSSASNQSVAQQTGVVTGKATDSYGNVLKGVNITVEHTVWLGTYLYATTNAKGKYSITIPNDPAGDWFATAQYTKKAYGKTYLFDMDGNQTAFSKLDAPVRNFTWKLSGKKPNNNGYYGAHIDLYQFGTDAQMDQIKIDFTPIDSVLIDGSPAVAFERTVEDVAGTYMVKDIPIGKYSIKAKYPGKKLYLDNRHDDKGAAIKQTVVFGKYGSLGETEYNIEFWVSE